MSDDLWLSIGTVLSMVCVFVVQELRWRYKRKCNKLWDDPQYDATDFAHPAFWRGEKWSCNMFCKIIDEILNGKKPKGRMQEPLEKLRWKLHRVITDRNRAELIIKDCFEVINGFDPNVKKVTNLEQQIAIICETLNKHTKYEGGVSMKCGHPEQCAYSCARVDGGPVRCSMCDMKDEIKRLKEYTKYVEEQIKDCRTSGDLQLKDYRSWWVYDYNKDKE